MSEPDPELVVDGWDPTRASKASSDPRLIISYLSASGVSDEGIDMLLSARLPAQVELANDGSGEPWQALRREPFNLSVDDALIIGQCIGPPPPLRSD